MNVCDAPQPQYLPDLVMDIIFSYLKLSDLYSCMLVCRNWNRAINDGRSEPWKSLCHRELLKSKLLAPLHNHKKSLQFIYNSWNPKDSSINIFDENHLLLPFPSPKNKLRTLYNSWNPKDCSTNIVVENYGFTFIRNPIIESTDMIRTKTGYKTGKHVWEITWNEELGTVAMIGLSTKKAPLHCTGYIPLLGANKHSWGWNLVDNVLLHNAIPHGNYPLLKNDPKYTFGEKLDLVLNCENGTLHFEKCNVFLGIAFKNLPKTKLYPSVSVVYGYTEVSVLYIGNTGSTR
ncbi:F-box/SPRY domain-containing protein 1-like [Metopolophium dirhodum]|uniref:F-box/SPRY domain-containing protein 1-like n=1 Tax=Metopolophium dirhodum TaxID=44670 RepID=UPI0029905935|nr:F-box/SPRY domain-containing protein 1-like [Metopolophium dirhodum]